MRPVSDLPLARRPVVEANSDEHTQVVGGVEHAAAADMTRFVVNELFDQETPSFSSDSPASSKDVLMPPPVSIPPPPNAQAGHPTPPARRRRLRPQSGASSDSASTPTDHPVGTRQDATLTGVLGVDVIEADAPSGKSAHAEERVSVGETGEGLNVKEEWARQQEREGDDCTRDGVAIGKVETLADDDDDNNDDRFVVSEAAWNMLMRSGEEGIKVDETSENQEDVDAQASTSRPDSQDTDLLTEAGCILHLQQSSNSIPPAAFRSPSVEASQMSVVRIDNVSSSAPLPLAVGIAIGLERKKDSHRASWAGRSLSSTGLPTEGTTDTAWPNSGRVANFAGRSRTISMEEQTSASPVVGPGPPSSPLDTSSHRSSLHMNVSVSNEARGQIEGVDHRARSGSLPIELGNNQKGLGPEAPRAKPQSSNDPHPLTSSSPLASTPFLAIAIDTATVLAVAVAAGYIPTTSQKSSSVSPFASSSNLSTSISSGSTALHAPPHPIVPARSRSVVAHSSVSAQPSGTGVSSLSNIAPLSSAPSKPVAGDSVSAAAVSHTIAPSSSSNVIPPPRARPSRPPPPTALSAFNSTEGPKPDSLRSASSEPVPIASPSQSASSVPLTVATDSSIPPSLSFSHSLSQPQPSTSSSSQRRQPPARPPLPNATPPSSSTC